MKGLVSAVALLSFVAAATVPAVAFAEDAPATAPVKKHHKHHSSTKASAHKHHTSKKKKDA